jgi:hypothetical protein
LNLADNSLIDDDGVKCLINLTELNLTKNNKITNDALIRLVKLRKLDLTDNHMISKQRLDYGLPDLKNIIALRSKYIAYKFPSIRDYEFFEIHEILNDECYRDTTLTEEFGDITNEFSNINI